MKFPKHFNPSSTSKATAPYNFVPLAEEIIPEISRRDHDIYHSDRYTGIIHCTLETKTPLYTRAALEKAELSTYREQDKEQKKKAKADFFYIDPATKQPVIPGSSLRGMLRTLVEIITFSKPQPVTDRQLYFRTLDTSLEIGKAYARRMVAGERNADGAYPNVQAGYMEKEGHNYYIRPAKKDNTGTQFFRVEEDLALRVIKANIGSAPLKNMSLKNERPSRRNPQKNETYWKPNNQYKWGRTPIWFKPVAPTSHKPESAQYYADVTNLFLRKSGEDAPGAGWVEGWFIASGWVPGPRSSRGKRLHWIVAPPDYAGKRCLVKDIDIDAYAELGAGRSQTIEKQKMSVLPTQAGELIPCFYTNWKDSDGNERIAFGHTAMFRLPYEYSPRDLLPYTTQQLQVTDFAEAIFGWVDDKKGRTIASRVSVRDAHVTDPSTSPHLLQRNEPPLTPLLSGPKPTSFQHYLTQGSDQKADLYHYQDKGDTTLRGHKLYWHKDDKLQRQAYHDNAAPADSTQHTVMRPVNKGVTFAFDLHFENLAAEELGALLWILRVAGDGKHCLKVGMAKPLGLGSVRIQARLCLSGRRARYRTLFSDLNWQEAPTCLESNALPELPTDQQFAKLNELLQNNETVEMADFVLFVRAFEEYVLAQLGVTDDNHATAFARLPRIATLLALLQWPGPSQDQTKYMQGPNNQHMDNEFKDRPVLPDPLWITQPVLQQISNRQKNVRTLPAVVAPLTETNAKLVAETILPPPQTLDELQDQDLLQGTVVRVEQDSVLVNVGPGNLRLHIDQVWPPVLDQKMLKDEFLPDRVINVRVQRKRSGKVNLTMKPSHA